MSRPPQYAPKSRYRTRQSGSEVDAIDDNSATAIDRIVPDLDRLEEHYGPPKGSGTGADPAHTAAAPAQTEAAPAQTEAAPVHARPAQPGRGLVIALAVALALAVFVAAALGVVVVVLLLR